MISQDGKQIGAIGLFSIDSQANLVRTENSGVIPDKPATPILDFTQNGVAQGYVEGANVNPIEEMTKLISADPQFRRRQFGGRADRILDGRRHQVPCELGPPRCARAAMTRGAADDRRTAKPPRRR